MNSIYSPLLLCLRCRTLVLLALACGAVAIPSFAVAPAFLDALDRPARQSPNALNGPFPGIAASGANAIAVGARGAILVSQDAGSHWKQVASPVSSDLTTVRFASERVAWAVGHDGVVLRSDDAGLTWNRVLDGRTLLELMTRHYQVLASTGKPEMEKLVVEVERAAAMSATPGVLPYPFLDIWFGNDGEGFIVGAFGFLLHTLDAGKSWEPWLERADNERRMHLYSVEQGADGAIYLAGEQGLLRRLNRRAGRFEPVETPYKGTYFGLKAAGQDLVAYGLRGKAFLSPDAGKTWKPVPLGVESSVVSVLTPQPGRLVFVMQSGHVLESRDGGVSVVGLNTPRGGEVLDAALAANNQLAMARINGVTAMQLPRH